MTHAADPPIIDGFVTASEHNRVVSSLQQQIKVVRDKEHEICTGLERLAELGGMDLPGYRQFKADYNRHRKN